MPLPSDAINAMTAAQMEATHGQKYVFVVSSDSATVGRGDAAELHPELPGHPETRDFQAIRKRAGIPECKFYDLRKSHCTNLAGSVPLHVVQELAGHADIRTTRKHDLQVRQEADDAAQRAVEEVLK